MTKEKLPPADCPYCGTHTASDEWSTKARYPICKNCYSSFNRPQTRLKKTLEQRRQSRRESQERRKEARRQRIEVLLPDDRRCPHCEQTKIRPQLWVINSNYIGCRSCWYAHGKPSGRKISAAEALKDTQALCESCRAYVDRTNFKLRLRVCKDCYESLRQTD